MRNPYEVLREKERELERVKREVEALQLVAPLEGEESASNKAIKPDPDVRKDATTGLQIPTQK